VSDVPDEEEFLFNRVWTGTVFPFLRYCVSSQLAHSGARFRFLANGCSPEQIPMMEAFREQHSDRVLEVLVVSEAMGAHGVALDTTMAQRDDGEFFCFIDPDILARGPFLRDFARHLVDGYAGVTSGKGVWVEDPTIPVGHVGVSGEYFYASDGYLFGSPHFAMYRRAALDATFARWGGLSFGSAGVRRLTEEGRDRLKAIGRTYWLYDTGKLANIFLQEDGNQLCHFEHENLMHIGGMSHYLSPPDGGGAADNADWAPDQSEWKWQVTRLEVAAYTAVVLRNLAGGHQAPEIPSEVDPTIAVRLEAVRNELITLVSTYP
jgi:hypothetical protein